jgi:hypothetical protein
MNAEIFPVGTSGVITPKKLISDLSASVYFGFITNDRSPHLFKGYCPPPQPAIIKKYTIKSYQYKIYVNKSEKGRKILQEYNLGITAFVRLLPRHQHVPHKRTQAQTNVTDVTHQVFAILCTKYSDAQPLLTCNDITPLELYI